jgi:hypothetical protein
MAITSASAAASCWPSQATGAAVSRLCHHRGTEPVRGPRKRLCEDCAEIAAQLRLIKGRCRAYTRKLIERGVIERQPCLICGAGPAEAHHVTYTNPRCVIFLCIRHHREHEAAKQAKLGEPAETGLELGLAA